MACSATHSHIQEPLSLTVSQEGAKLTGEDMMVEGDEEVLVELEGRGKLHHDLPHTVQELCEDRRCLFNVTC